MAMVASKVYNQLMNTIWKGSPNYWAGRTQRISEILIHWMNGTLAATDATFANEANEVSAHSGYEDDNRHDYVRIQDTAWAARQANPFTINLELSAAPGRAPSDKTYENVIRDCAAYCKQFGLDTDMIKALNPHKKYVNTRCSGNDIASGIPVEFGGVDLKRIRDGVAALLKGSSVPPVVVTPDKPSLPQPVANKSTDGTLHLPGSATSWRVYPLNKAPTIGNQIGYLNPSLRGGLTYEILANPTANVYTIQTRDFDKVNIYAGAETGATVAATNQGVTMGSGGGKTVYLPSVPTWRVYRPGGPYTIGSEVGYLAPARQGGLAYAVISQPAPNVAVIQTRDFDRVAIYVGSETGAIIK